MKRIIQSLNKNSSFKINDNKQQEMISIIFKQLELWNGGKYKNKIQTKDEVYKKLRLVTNSLFFFIYSIYLSSFTIKRCTLE